MYRNVEVSLWESLRKWLVLFFFVLLGGTADIMAQSRVIPRSPVSPSAQPPSTGVSTVRPTQSAGPVSVAFRDNRLSVEARDSDLRTVIDRIVTQTNIEVRHLDGLTSTRVSVRFVDLPVVEGLKRLFRAAEVSGYALITESGEEEVQVRRILFLPSTASPTGLRPSGVPGRRLATGPVPNTPITPAESSQSETQQEESESGESTISSSGGSVFEDLKVNTTARRLLSQLVHPNEQVRERALESLIQLVGEDQKQAQLLEFLEPLMDDMASDDKTAREDARAEIRKLLSR